MKIFYLTRDRRRPRQWKGLFVSLTPEPYYFTERATPMALYTGTYWVPTCEIVNSHRASEYASKFQGSGQL